MRQEVKASETEIYRLLTIANANVARARRERRFEEFIFWNDVYGQSKQILGRIVLQRNDLTALVSELRVHMRHVNRWLGRPYNDGEEPDSGEDGGQATSWWEWH